MKGGRRYRINPIRCLIYPMTEKKIGGITVHEIAHSIVDTLFELHKRIGISKIKKNQNEQREYLIKVCIKDSDGYYGIDQNQFKGLINGGVKSSRANDYVQKWFKEAVMKAFDIIISYNLSVELVDEKTINFYGLELPKENAALSSEEQKSIRNNIILWCLLISNLEKKKFNSNKYLERFKKNLSFRDELGNLLEEMYPPKDKRLDYSYIDELKKEYKILVVTDDRDSLIKVRKYAKKALGDAKSLFSIKVADEDEGEEYDIIYIIDNDGNISSENIQEVSCSHKYNCIKKVFYNSKIKKTLGSKVKGSFIEYNDKDVYLLSIVEDVMGLMEKDQILSRRYAQRIEKLKNLSDLCETEKISDHINSAKVRDEWENLLEYSDKLMETSKEIYQEYIKEQKILIDNDLFSKNMPERILINSLKSNVDKQYYGDLMSLYYNSDKKYDMVIDASREKIKAVYHLCYGIGDFLMDTKEYSLAFEFLQIACGLSELMKDDYLVFESTLNLIQAYWRLKNYDKVDELIESIEKNLSESYSEDRGKYYMLYRDLKHYKGNSLHAQRRLDEAIVEFKEARDAIEGRFPGAFSDEKKNIEGRNYKNSNVETYDDEFANAAKKLSGTYNNMSIVYRRLLDRSNAIWCSKKCITINARLHDHRKNAVAYRNMAVLFYSDYDLSFGKKRTECERCFERSQKEYLEFIKTSQRHNALNETAQKKEEFGYELAYAEYCIRMGNWIIEDDMLKNFESYLDWLKNAEEHVSNAREVFDSIKPKEQLPSEKMHLARVNAKINLSYYIGNTKEVEKGEEACRVYREILEDIRNKEENEKGIIRLDRKFYVLYDLTMYYNKKKDNKNYKQFGEEMLNVRKELIKLQPVYGKYPEVIDAFKLTKDLRKKK